MIAAVVGVVSLVISTALGYALGMVYRSYKRRRAVARVVIEYRDATGTGEWCTFETIREAYEAVGALADVYAGSKTFWLRESSIPTGTDYFGFVEHPYPAIVPAPSAPPKPPKPKARPKPGTPIVRQRPSGWYVQTGLFEIGYGPGEEGYRAALAAVERAHKQA